MKKILLLLPLFVVGSLFGQNKERLIENINSILKDKKASVGVAVIYSGKDTITVNNDKVYPTLSVFKFPLALTILDHLDRNKLSLDTKILVRKDELVPNTHSPLRDKYSNKKDIKISIKELLEYTVAQSDNNGADILLRYIGGPKVVNDYVKSLGISNISIVATEKKMHEKFSNQYLNKALPLSAVQLMETFLRKDLFKKEYKDFLIKTLISTSTGSGRIKGLLPSSVVVGHKTGSSDRDEKGFKIADNDLGFVYLPNKDHYSIVVFVTDTMESDQADERIIAEISKEVYDYFTHKGDYALR